MRRPARLALLVAALSLLGSVAASVSIHRRAVRELEALQTERLKAAGELSSALLVPSQGDGALLSRLMEANRLEGAWLVDANGVVLADARGAPGRKLDLLRADPAGLAAARAGQVSVGRSYQVGEVGVWTGYFPVREAGEVRAVLGLEAGEAFSQPLEALRWGLWASLVLSLLGSAALGALTVWWTRGEQERVAVAERAARADLLARLAAAAAHEIRNPLGIIRGNAELMRERLGDKLSEKDWRALADIQGEVERLKQLTEDLMALDEKRPLTKQPLSLKELLEGVAAATEAAFPGVKVRRGFGELPDVEGDPARLRQALLNLLANAAQAQPAGEIGLEAVAKEKALELRVSDQGPGVSEEVRARLFEPFATGREGGTGLGLHVSRALVERHGGTLVLREGLPTVFVLTLPR